MSRLKYPGCVGVGVGVCVCVGGGAYSYMKVIYMCRPEFENGGIRERSLAENGDGGLSERPLTEKQGGDFGTKIAKKRIFLKVVGGL